MHFKLLSDRDLKAIDASINAYGGAKEINSKIAERRKYETRKKIAGDKGYGEMLEQAEQYAGEFPKVEDFVEKEGVKVTKKGVLLELSAREFRLLQYFIENAGQVIDRDTLLDAVWDYDEPPLTRTVDMHVAKLRKKLEDEPADPKYIVTVHRLGYKLVEN